MINCKKFGEISGEEVKIYTLETDKALVEILTYGGTIRTFSLKGDVDTDVVLGYDTIEEYVEHDGYLGALIGRVGNRIDKGTFVLNGKEYHVGINDGENSLHGGIYGFNAKIWRDSIENDKLVLKYLSVDGEEGYPGNLEVTVCYSLNGSALKIEYSAVCDQDTPLNLTNHVYFNLAGQGKGDILDTEMYIDGYGVTITNKDLIPTGEVMNVAGTPYDFNTPKLIGKDIFDKHEQIVLGNGYDINYALNGNGFRKIAEAKSVRSGIKLDVYTDQIGVQFYSGNFLNGYKGKGKSVHNFRNGFCLETQGFPNAVNCPTFPSCVLKKGEKFESVTVYELNK